MFISQEPGIEKLKFPSKVATFPTISYVFLHLKLKNFHRMTKFLGHQVTKLPIFLPSLYTYFLKWYVFKFQCAGVLYMLQPCELMMHHITGIGISLSIINPLNPELLHFTYLPYILLTNRYYNAGFKGLIIMTVITQIQQFQASLCSTWFLWIMVYESWNFNQLQM